MLKQSMCLTASTRTTHTCFISQSITDDLNLPLPLMSVDEYFQLNDIGTWSQVAEILQLQTFGHNLHSKLGRIFDHLLAGSS